MAFEVGGTMLFPKIETYVAEERRGIWGVYIYRFDFQIEMNMPSFRNLTEHEAQLLAIFLNHFS